ncbi:MAG TPA: DNA polymerase ligase N-terminal domain-containing protein [Thermodesulfobacteriota bacterium]|jgi:bifunctional non-homologous end joining protein LigD
MNGTHRFLIQKHHTEHPHFDLKLEFGELMKSWILPTRIPGEGSVKTVAIEMKERVFKSDGFMSAIDDQYGIGEAEIWDRGRYDIITKSNEKITLHAKGELFKGRFVFIVPSWGRWTGKRLWILIRIYDR